MTDTSKRGDVVAWARLQALASGEPVPPMTQYEQHECALELIELRSIACAAEVMADAGPGKLTGPMWTRLWSLLNDRVRRGLVDARRANGQDPRTGRALAGSSDGSP